MHALVAEIFDTEKQIAQTRIRMTILPHPTWPAPPCFAPHGFYPPCKGGGVRIERDFSIAPQGRTGMSLDFLDPTYPIPPRVDKS